jgi:hypothetical protein
VTASRGQLSGCGVREETNKQSSQNLYLHYVQGDHLVEAKSSGDGVRDLGDVLGGEGDKGVFVLTSVGPGTSSWRRSERAGRGVTGLRGCNGIRGGRRLGEAWFAH